MTRTKRPTSTKRRPKPKSSLKQITEKVVSYFNGNAENSITDAILMDHKALKSLLKILKSKDSPTDKKKTAFNQFKSLLNSHSHAEEKALYSISKHIRDLRRKTSEGFVEHDVAENLLGTIKSTPSQSARDHWQAQVQVLSELVEHHLEEEESDLLPQVKRKLTDAQQKKHAKIFLRLRSRSQKLKRSANRGALEGLDHIV